MKPSHAAKPPGIPARAMPSPMPVCELAGEKLAQRYQVGVALVVQPSAALDDLIPEVAEVRDGAAEQGQAKLGENGQHF